MQLFHPHARRRRALGATLVALGGLCLLGASMFDTQIVHNTAYSAQSERNRLRPMLLPAPRGTIYDRTGAVLATNETGYALSILPIKSEAMQRELEELAPYVGLSPARVQTLLTRFRESPTLPLIVSNDLTFAQVSAIEERRHIFPGVFVDMRPKRHYT